MDSDMQQPKCNICSHRKVCSLKETFLRVQETVNNLSVSIENHGTKHLCDFDWIKKVSLNCVHFEQAKSSIMREAKR